MGSLRRIAAVGWGTHGLRATTPHKRDGAFKKYQSSEIHVDLNFIAFFYKESTSLDPSLIPLKGRKRTRAGYPMSGFPSPAASAKTQASALTTGRIKLSDFFYFFH